MSEPQGVSCERPASGPIGEPRADATTSENPKPEENRPMIRIGQKAPDFSAPAFINGSFGSARLSNYLGKWVVLCFYPGDFTFV